MKKNHDVKQVEMMGYWWLPETPDNRVAGTFLFDKFGVISVTLFGTLRSDPKHRDKTKLCPIVVGYSLDGGNLITLEDCALHSRSLTIINAIPDAIARTEIATGCQAFFGFNCDEPDDLKFDKVILEMDFLRDWLVYREPEEKFVGDNSDRFQITYPSPDANPIICKIGKIQPNFNMTINSHICDGIKVEQFESISVELDESISFSEWKNRVILPLCNFITLATDRWCSVDKVKVSDRSHRYSPPLPDLPITFEVYSGFPKAEYDQDLCYFPLFTFEQVKEDATGILDRWFDIAEKYKPSCELFFSVMQTSGSRGNKMDLNNQFLNLAQALESFHNIRAGCDKHLKNCLPDLIDEVGEVILPIIGDQPKFVDLVVATRNYYTHYNPNKSNISAHGDDLNSLTLALKILMHMVLLRQLELPNNIFKTMFIGNSDFKYLKQRVLNYSGYLRNQVGG